MIDPASLLMADLYPVSTGAASGSNGSGKEISAIPFDQMLSEAIENTKDLPKGPSFDEYLSSILALGFYSTPVVSSTGVSGSSGNMQVSDSLVNFIASKEGYSATAYRGVDSQNQTIGYGHVIQPGENYTYLSKSDALKLLKSDIQKYSNSVNQEFSGTSLSQNQFDSLVSFSYNLGANIWDSVPKLTSDIKSGASADTLREDFARCCHCNGEVVSGLYNRRISEWKMFCYGNYYSA